MAKMRFFGPSLRVQEAARHSDVTYDQAGIRGEYHVRATRLRRDFHDGGVRPKHLAQAVPLFGGTPLRGTMDVAGHPRIDDVIDAEKLG